MPSSVWSQREERTLLSNLRKRYTLTHAEKAGEQDRVVGERFEILDEKPPAERYGKFQSPVVVKDRPSEP